METDCSVVMERDGGGFSELLQRAEQLNADIDGEAELPRVMRNLQQIRENSRRLWTKAAQTGNTDATDVKASILLGSKGLDVPRIQQKLDSISTAKTFDPLEPIRDIDVQGFLKNERENAILSSIEQSRKQTFEQVEGRHWESVMVEWDEEKERILNQLVSSGYDVTEQSVESQLPDNDSPTVTGRSSLNDLEMAYYSVILRYNQHVIDSCPAPPLVELCLELANNRQYKQLVDMWLMVRTVLSTPPSTQSNVLQLRESFSTQASFMKQSKTYLQQSYNKYMMETCCDNLELAQLGGVPGTSNIVRSFLNIKTPICLRTLEDGLVDGQPLWPTVYYCIRSGDLNTAISVLQDSLSQDVSEFIEILTEYTQNNGRLSISSESKVKLHYRRIVVKCQDPYKCAVYNIVGNCDVDENHADICDRLEDYIWLKLCQVRFDEECKNRDNKLTLSQLQDRLLIDYGETHFHGYQQPFLYFMVLFLTCQFEAAVEFLARVDSLRCHAVHVALVLHETGFLLNSRNIQAPLLSREVSDRPGLRRLNFARLVMLYTRQFESTNQKEALQYFYFLRDQYTIEGGNLFTFCVTQLALESRQFTHILGRLQIDGSRKPGYIDHYKIDSCSVIDNIAHQLEQIGEIEEAVTLYDLAENQSKVVSLLNKVLSQVISAPSTAQRTTRDRLKHLATSIATRYSKTGHIDRSLLLLLDLMSFFDFYFVNDIDVSLDIIMRLNIIPLSTEAVESKVANFKQFSDEVRQCVPDLILATMNILHSKCVRIKTSLASSPITPGLGSSVRDGGQDSVICQLRTQARALITYAGIIPYRMPGETNARLVQLETLMN